MRVGTWYHPTHWPREQWAADLETIAESGLDPVRIGAFYWSTIEPHRGAFDFEWLDATLDICADLGLEVVCGTPTAAPPKWLVDEHPDILPQGSDGTVNGWGSRRHYCFNSPTYRRETERIVRRVAEHVGDRSVIVGWQVDNEFGWGGTTRCYCDDCAAAFRDWLRDRYPTIDAVNDAWGTEFWSQTYGSFEAVDPPRETVAGHHPSRLLAYHRFASDSVAEYNALQADLLRSVDSEWWVTHNFMCDFPHIDPYRVSEDLDLVTWDNYPTLHGQIWTGDPEPSTYRTGDPHQSAMNHDLYRSIHTAPFWVMELQAGDTMATPYAPEPATGAMRLWAHHAAAHGADVLEYFRWRRCREGQEQYWGGLRRHDGSQDRGYDEAKRAADELRSLGELAAPKGDVAILHGYDNLWALNIDDHAPDFRYWDHLRTYYRPLRQRGLTIDVVRPTDRIQRYPLVIAPSAYVIDESVATAIRQYVANGGTAVLTIRSGVKDEHNKLLDSLPPGPLTDVVGARVAQHESLPDVLETRIRYGTAEYDYKRWAEWLEPTDADPVAHHRSGPARGEPAITRNAYGEGEVYYVGVWPEPDLADAFLASVLDRCGVEHPPRAPDRVQVSERDGYVWVCNFTTRTVDVEVPPEASWPIGGPTVDPADVAVTDASRAAVTVE